MKEPALSTRKSGREPVSEVDRRCNRSSKRLHRQIPKIILRPIARNHKKIPKSEYALVALARNTRSDSRSWLEEKGSRNAWPRRQPEAGLEHVRATTRLQINKELRPQQTE